MSIQEHKRSCRNGAIARAKQIAVFNIEGEQVTRKQIAYRLGVHPTTACIRLKREQAKPGRITWDGLREIGQ